METGYKAFTLEVLREIEPLLRVGLPHRARAHGQDLPRRLPHLRGADRLLRPLLRGGQEDHLARRLPRGVRARQVPLPGQVARAARARGGRSASRSRSSFGWLAIRGLNFHEVRSRHRGDASPAWILAGGRRRRWSGVDDALRALAHALPARLAPGRRADVLGLAGRPAREQRAARARRRAGARAGALPRVGAAAHARCSRRSSSSASSTWPRSRCCSLRSPSRLPDDRRRAALHAAGGRRSWPPRRVIVVVLGDHARAPLRGQPAACASRCCGRAAAC